MVVLEDKDCWSGFAETLYVLDSIGAFRYTHSVCAILGSVFTLFLDVDFQWALKATVPRMRKFTMQAEIFFISIPVH